MHLYNKRQRMDLTKTPDWEDAVHCFGVTSATRVLVSQLRRQRRALGKRDTRDSMQEFRLGMRIAALEHKRAQS
jgi:hypothetical protein